MLQFRENPAQSPQGSCLCKGKLEQVFGGVMPFYTNQLGLGKRHWNLETSSAVVEFPPPYCTDWIDPLIDGSTDRLETSNWNFINCRQIISDSLHEYWLRMISSSCSGIVRYCDARVFVCTVRCKLVHMSEHLLANKHFLSLELCLYWY